MRRVSMRHYFAVLEPAASGALHISFPGLDGVGSFAERPTDIVQQAFDALESALIAGGTCRPRSRKAPEYR
jgi:hypothetical protein